MTYDYELGQSDLIPDSWAPCEAEERCDECDYFIKDGRRICRDCYMDALMCDECGIDEANDIGLCADCAREIQLQQLEDGK